MKSVPALFILDIATDAAAGRATLRLRDNGGHDLAVHEVALAEHAAPLWSGLFETRRHVMRMKDVEPPDAHLAAIGRFLGDHVLGADIARALAVGVESRTPLVRAPDPTRAPLAASFARVPWEITLAPGDARTLLARNLVVCVAPGNVRLAIRWPPLSWRTNRSSLRK